MKQTVVLKVDAQQPDTEKVRMAAGIIRDGGLVAFPTETVYGLGANGKSVIHDIVRALIGPENISSYSLQSLTNNTGYQRAEIANKLVNYASEINTNLEATYFKALVSGEPIEARIIYGRPFIIENYAKFIFNCNELPFAPEHTLAFFRRFLIIPFEVTIPPERQDKDLANKIINNEATKPNNA